MDLLRSNDSNTGIRVNTDVEGLARFEIFPDYVHKFLAYVSGQQHTTDALTGGEDDTLKVTVTLAKPALARVAEELAFGMDQNFPNPFNPSTTIRYTLAEPCDVRLTVYDVLGQQVRALERTARAAGVHTVSWDGQDALGRKVASGVYIYRLQAGPGVAIRRMILSR